MRRNVLNSRQRFALNKYLEQELPNLRQSQPSYADFAEQATKHLGWEVTRGNIEKAVEDVGVEWPRQKPLHLQHYEGMAMLARRFNELAERTGNRDLVFELAGRE